MRAYIALNYLQNHRGGSGPAVPHTVQVSEGVTLLRRTSTRGPLDGVRLFVEWVGGRSLVRPPRVLLIGVCVLIDSIGLRDISTGLGIAHLSEGDECMTCNGAVSDPACCRADRSHR